MLGRLRGIVEDHKNLRTRVAALDRDTEQLRQELMMLRRENDVLRAEREELLAAFNGLAGHVTQVADQILQRFGEGEAPE